MSLNELEKGLYGEIKVITYLDIMFKGIKYIHDISLPKNNLFDSTLTQIDFLVFTNRGFYCLEVKAWHGILTVLNKDYCRLQTKTRIINIMNPVLQNNSHIRNLKRQSKYEFKPLLVFTDINKINGFGNQACYLSDLKSIIESQPIIYTDEEVEEQFSMFKRLKESTKFQALGKHLAQLENIKDGLM